MQRPGLRLIELVDDMCAGRDVFFRWVRLVRDVMVTDVKTLKLADTVGTCLRFMKDHHIRHVPVVDAPAGEEEPYLVGVVSERDVFRQVSPYVGKLGEEETDREALKRPLARIVTRDVRTTSPDLPVPDAIAAMVDHRVDSLPVLDDGNLVGILTAGDIVKLFVRLDRIRRMCGEAGKKTRIVDVVSGGSADAGSLVLSALRTVEDVMTEEVVALAPNDTVGAAMEVMREGRFRHVPIVGAEGKLLGIVSDRDIVHRLGFYRGQPGLPDAFRGRLFTAEETDKALSLPLRQIMTGDVVTVSRDARIYTAARKLYEMKLSCLPVVEGAVLQGMVTVTDLMRALLGAYNLIGTAA